MPEKNKKHTGEFSKRNDGQVQPQKSVAPKVSPGKPPEPPKPGKD